MHVPFYLVLKCPDVNDSAKEVIKSPWRLLKVHSFPSHTTLPQGLILQDLSLQVLT